MKWVTVDIGGNFVHQLFQECVVYDVEGAVDVNGVGNEDIKVVFTKIRKNAPIDN